LHAPVPEQAPVQPTKVEPVAAVAVKLTAVPTVNDSEHVPGQAMPPPATEPVVVPPTVTVSVCVTGAVLAVPTMM
jgi:hypothetical protein